MPPAPRRVSAAESRSTLSSSNAPCLWASVSSMRTTSPGLSSTRRIRTGEAVVTFRSLLRWELDGVEPEVLDRADHLKELIDTEWLGHVTVRVERIAPGDVFLGRGRGEDDDRDLLELLVLLDLPEQVAPVPLGQVEIQEDDVGSRTCAVCPFAVEE